MKTLLIGLLAIGSVSAYAASEKIQVEIKASTKELCQLTSDSAFKDIEADLREVGARVESISSCNRGLDGKFRKTLKFEKSNL